VLTGLVVGIVVGGACAAAVVTLVWSSRSQKERVVHASGLATAKSDVARLDAELEAERRLGAARELAWEEARSALKGEFASLSATALQTTNEQFLQLASGKFETERQAARGELDNRVRSIEQLLTPIREHLDRNEDAVRHLETLREGAYAGLLQQVKQLNESHGRLEHETRNLVTALRAPATRGRWGELQLRRVMEMAGMLEHCDFNEQVTEESELGRRRPDVVVHLTGGKNLVIDSKVPLEAFLRALESEDAGERKSHLEGHARQLRVHVDSLSKKSYWEQFEVTPEFVIAFVPSDPLLTTALEHDPLLLDHAIERKVILATPMSLIAMLRAIAFGWQQESLAENAQEVQKAGRDLYKRLATFGEHLAKAGRGLSGAVDSYNKAIGSLEHNVLPQARRFQDLGVVGSGQAMPQLEPIDAMPRVLQAPELVAADMASQDESREYSPVGRVVELESDKRKRAGLR
jgi:DNA recombination protein RmuC